MSLSEELDVEQLTAGYSGRGSQIDTFVDNLTPSDRADFNAWMASDTKNISAMYRVLKRRGLPVAPSTFGNWVNHKCP